MLALHAAAGVDGDRRRRVFSVRFLGDDMRHAPRSWVTSPAFPGLAERLPAGAPMDDSLFPVLWDCQMNLVRCDALEPQPWRNGGGLTRELLAWPSRDDWALRISVADIRADGPFSAFPGVDRWFAVLEGDGVLLALPEGRRSVEADGRAAGLSTARPRRTAGCWTGRRAT